MYNAAKNKKVISQQRGKRNRAQGEIFEENIKAACEYYRMHKIADIRKNNEPMKPVGKPNAKGVFPAVFTSKAEADFKGILHGGKTIAFEAKFTDDDRIQQSRVSKAQAAMLDRYSEMGALCFVLVSFRFEIYAFIPWDLWSRMKPNFGRKYIKRSEVGFYKVPFCAGIVDFLKAVDDKWQ